MGNTYGCFVAIVSTVVQHLELGNFVTQFDMGQPARLGEGRAVYWFKGWSDCRAQISGEVIWYEYTENLQAKVNKAKLRFVWRNDWRENGKSHHGQFECEYQFPDAHGPFKGGLQNFADVII